MTLKLLFHPETGRILGAQAVGGAGVDKRIDVLAVAIQAGMTVFDLEEMELAYAPQYGSAKDPINMAGFVAGGLLRGDHPQIDVETVLAAPPEQRPLLLDVRTPQEFSAGNIPGAMNMPVDESSLPAGGIPRDRADRRLLPGGAAWLLGDQDSCGRRGSRRRTSAAATRRTSSFIRSPTAWPPDTDRSIRPALAAILPWRLPIRPPRG